MTNLEDFGSDYEGPEENELPGIRARALKLGVVAGSDDRAFIVMISTCVVPIPESPVFEVYHEFTEEDAKGFVQTLEMAIDTLQRFERGDLLDLPTLPGDQAPPGEA